MPCRLMVVDDHWCIHDWVRLVCTHYSNGQFVLAAEIRDAKTALARCQEVNPEIVLLDIWLKDGSGLEVGEQMRSLIPEAKIVFFTATYSDLYAREARRMGAAAFLVKSETTDLIETLSLIRDGQSFFPAPRRPMISPQH